MKKNTKVIFGSAMILLAILVLLVAVTPASSGYEITIGHLKDNPQEYTESYITTEGYLLAESVDWNADDIELRFEIEDEDGHILPVYHHGVQPDNFEDDVIIIVHGYLQDDGVFEAEKIQTRCPSKYEGMDAEDYDPEIHRQMDWDLLPGLN